MSTKRFLGEDQLAVNRDLKKTTSRRDQLPRTNKLLKVPFLQNFSRQTDGTA